MNRDEARDNGKKAAWRTLMDGGIPIQTARPQLVFESGYELGFDAGYQAATPAWVSVSERLPDCPGMYLTTFFGGGRWLVDTIRFAEGDWVENARLVTAWMPIPAYTSGE